MDAKDVFPIRLKSEWDKSGLTGKQFASKIGVSERTLFAWLNPNDERSPKRERLPILARILGCSVDWLLGVSDVRTPDTAELKIDDEVTRNLMVEVLSIRAAKAPKRRKKKARVTPILEDLLGWPLYVTLVQWFYRHKPSDELEVIITRNDQKNTRQVKTFSLTTSGLWIPSN